MLFFSPAQFRNVSRSSHIYTKDQRRQEESEKNTVIETVWCKNGCNARHGKKFFGQVYRCLRASSSRSLAFCSSDSGVSIRTSIQPGPIAQIGISSQPSRLTLLHHFFLSLCSLLRPI